MGTGKKTIIALLAAVVAVAAVPSLMRQAMPEIWRPSLHSWMARDMFSLPSAMPTCAACTL